MDMKTIQQFKNKTIICIVFILMLSTQIGLGQSTANYTYLTHTTGSLTDMTTGTTDLLATGIYRTNVASPITNIGFTFYYMSTAYTQFSINCNGQMRLGGTVITGTTYSTPPFSIALLAPINGLNSIQASGKVHYKVTGTAPNRILIVEWVDLRIPASNTVGTYSRMQVLLYETTGKIEYVYGTMYNNSTSQSRSIFHSSNNVDNTVGWLGGINTATPTYSTTGIITQTSLVNSSAIANLTSAADGARRVFSFTPPLGPVSAAPTWAPTPISNTTTAGMKLNWIDNASNESGYQILRSTDNITYTTIAVLSANINTYFATGLTPSTLYYWKVVAFSEGSVSLNSTVESMSTTATSTFTSIASGNWSNGSTWSTGNVPALTDDVIIDLGHTVTIDAPGLAAKTLTINGFLTYHATTVSALTVNGDIKVNASGSFTSPASGTVETHALNIGGSTATGVGGNLIVDGIFNMNVFSTAGVLVTFYGTPNNAISGIGSVINLFSLNVNKGLSNTSILDVTSVITCPDANATIGQRINVSVGTLKISSATVVSPYYGYLTATQAVNARLWLNNAAAHFKSVGAGTVGGSTATISFGGMLQIDAGTISIGNGLSSVSIFGNFSMGGANATLNVYGYFYSGNSSTYTITAGNINIFPQVGANYAPATYFSQSGLFAFGGTALNFTGGTLTIFDPTLAVSSGSYYAPISVYIYSGTNNLAGSTIRFGNGISDNDGSVDGFSISTVSYVLGNVIVNNALSSVKTTRTLKALSHLTIAGNLTINSGAANQFLLNGFMLNTRGNIVNSGTFTFDVAAPGNTTSGLTFTGTTQQIVSGGGTFSTNVNNLIVNNTSGANPAVDLQFPISISNSLSLTRGILGSSNSSVFTMGKSGYPTFNLIRAGGSLASAPTFALGGVTTFNVTYSAPSPAASTTTSVELPAAIPITLFTVSNASGVTLDKAVSCSTLALTSGILTTTGSNSMTVTGTGVANITGGSTTAYVNGPLKRTVPSGAVGLNYKFPVGKTAYRLIEFATITTGGSGNAIFTVEAFDAGPYTATAGSGLSTVSQDRYWSLSAALGSVTITASTIRLTDSGLGVTNKMGQSNNAFGTYNSVGATVGGSTLITSTAPIDYSAISTGTYLRIGQASAFASGIYAIGPQLSYSGYVETFASMTAAVAAITAVPLPGHVIFEFQNDYNPNIEATTVSMTSSIASSATSTVTFRPAPSVGSIINFSKTVAIINNAGADYIIFDGRNGGTGTNKFMQFTNTTTTAAAIVISGDALYNQLLYCVLKGSTTTASTGILTINAPSTGNNFYTIDNCIFDGSGLANNCIYVTGVSSGATILNSNFFNYRNGAGINLASGSDNSIIYNNNFYQTIAYTGFAGTTYGIYVASGNNCQINNNNIGGSGPEITGTWTVSATTPAAYNFTGIYASLGTTSKIYNNKIQNIDWKSTPATWTGINGNGNVNIGGDGTNFIGNSTGIENIKITYYNTNGAAVVNGILIG